MEKVLLIVCRKCGKVRHYGNWVVLTQEQRTDLFLQYRVEKLKCLCPACYALRNGSEVSYV